MLRKISLEKYILFLVLFVGAFLRFYRFSEIDFTHDELSALGRLRFDNFSDLIQYGVKENDFHPAGIQVFLYLWSSIFGIGEMAIKLPFVLMGIASIYLVYKVGKSWANESVGLIVASILATTQLFIFYSQIARPYVSGLFLCLLMVYYWTEIIKSEKKRVMYYVWFSLFAVLACYNHYFSFLTAIIIGFTGFLFLNREKMIPYLISSLAVFLLYLPHFPIAIYQLSRGGVGGDDGWLGAPPNDFIFQFFKYFLHFDWGYSFVFLSIVLFSFLLMVASLTIKPYMKNRLQVLGLVWFFFLFSIGFFYSKYVNPILQTSLLIFVMPFFLISILSFIQLKGIKLIGVVLMIVVFSTASLFSKREHYKLMVNQPFSNYIEKTEGYLQVNDSEDYLAYFNSQPYFLEYYSMIKGSSFDYSVIYDTAILPKDFSPQSEELILGELPLNLLGKSFENYSIDKIESGFNHEIFFLKKGSHESDFIEKSIHNVIEPQIIDSSIEWTKAIEISLDTFLNSRHDYIHLSIELEFIDSIQKEGVLVMEVMKNNENLIWLGEGVQDFFMLGDIDGDIHLLTRLIDKFKSLKEVEDTKIKVYYWNKGRGNVQIKSSNLELIKGNRYKYGLYENISL